jgi:hypothetical protein
MCTGVLMMEKITFKKTHCMYLNLTIGLKYMPILL